MDTIWHESGGQGDRTILLLHGLGATAAVWAHVEKPESIVAMLEQLTDACLSTTPRR